MTEALQATIDAIDAINSLDPRQEKYGNETWPKELLYSHRMSERLADFLPDAPETLQIAARAQHIARWEIPRDDYPLNRTGYQRWRVDLGKMHADKTADIMAQQGYAQADQDLVRQLLTKRGIKSHPLVQALEDVICLVFIEHYLEAFASKHDQSKMISIIQKTWRKMSNEGHQAGLKINLAAPVKQLVEQALA